MTSVLRVGEFSQILPEDNAYLASPPTLKAAEEGIEEIPKTNAIAKGGQLEFRNVVLRYSKKGPTVLNHVSFKCRANEKVIFEA